MTLERALEKLIDANSEIVRLRSALKTIREIKVVRYGCAYDALEAARLMASDAIKSR